MNFLVVIILGMLLLNAAGRETTVAEWDFTRSLTSTDGRFVMKMRGNSRHLPAGIDVAVSGEAQWEGAISEAVYEELSPEGAFTVEVQFTLRKGIAPRSSDYLLLCDNKYIYHPKKKGYGVDGNAGFAFALHPYKGRYIPVVLLGLGDHSAHCQTAPVELEIGRRYSLSFDYDGISSVALSLDGREFARRKIEGGRLARSKYPFTVGDRVYSNYKHFEGIIHSLRIRRRDPEIFSIEASCRAFLANSAGKELHLSIRNESGRNLHDISISTSMIGAASQILEAVSSLQAGGTMQVRIPVDTRMIPGEYPMGLHITAMDQAGGKIAFDAVQKLLIGRESGDGMQVIMWGGESTKEGLAKLIPLGFTHALYYTLTEPLYRFSSDPNLVPGQYRILDFLLANNMGAYDTFELAYRPEFLDKYPRLDRSGKPYRRKNLEASHPEILRVFPEIAARSARVYGKHPAYQGMLVLSEKRDATAPSFRGIEEKNFRKFSGFSVPSNVESKKGIHYYGLKDFPVSRIIPETDPLYVYYRWFWKDGDGWNPLISRISDAVNKEMAGRFFNTFFDPAVRTPPIWGSGGSVDFISHWTYAYPDPICVGFATDELLAMKAGNPDQDVMSMTQIISYRSQVAPKNQKVSPVPQWLKNPDAAEAPYLTLAPDLLEEAFWCMISRKISGIMFHGYGSLVGSARNPRKTYYYGLSNEETGRRLAGLVKKVVKPLGPVLKRIPERDGEVAMLQSFSSSIFAGRGTWGWGGWGSEAGLIMQWAHLNPRILYEETILKEGLDKVKVLILFDCDVLTEKVFARIREFQRRGGIIIGDDHLTPALLPDIFVRSSTREGNPEKAKKRWQKVGAQIRSVLDSYYRPYADASSQDLITRVRSWKNADYLFVVNDRRTFGDYWGPFGLVMEKCLPLEGTVRLRRRAGAVYDLVNSGKVPFSVTAEGTDIPVNFKSAGGRLLLVLDEPVERISCSFPQLVEKGQSHCLKVQILSRGGRPIRALFPVKVNFRSGNGIGKDDIRYFCAENGSLTADLPIPLNLQSGEYSLEISELASGMVRHLKFRIR